MNLFDRLDDWINNTEGSLVNALTALAPWIAPAAPAYMTYQHMINFLDFPQWLAVGLAFLVEILGFGTVSTGLDFWFYNRRERSGAKKAPLGIIIGVFVFYLGLILVSNVVIDIANAYLTVGYQKGAIILVRALLTLQTIPGALIVASRTGHRDLLKEIKKEKESKITSGLPEVPKHFRNTSGSTSKMGRPSVHQERVFSYMEESLRQNGEVPTFTDLAKDLNLPQSTASRLRNEWLAKSGNK